MDSLQFNKLSELYIASIFTIGQCQHQSAISSKMSLPQELKMDPPISDRICAQLNSKFHKDYAKSINVKVQTSIGSFNTEYKDAGLKNACADVKLIERITTIKEVKTTIWNKSGYGYDDYVYTNPITSLKPPN